MPSWLIRIRDIIWSSVFAVVLSALAIIVAFIAPDALSLSISLGLGAVTSALLAQRV
jgi:hypothetical protein